MTSKAFVTAALALLAAVPAFAELREYSADMAMRSADGSVSGKIYVSGQLMRYEMGPAITITRLDRNVSYVLMPEQKMYMQQPIDPSAGVRAGVEPEGDVTRESLGQESFDGQSVEKVKVTYTDASGSSTIYQWLDGGGFPVKVEAEDGSWSVEYRNKQVGSQPAELFEVPSDYQSFAMPDLSQIMASATQQE